MSCKDEEIERYLEEELTALVPRYQQGASSTLIYTRQGKQEDQRSTSWLVKRLAAYYSLDLAVLRSNCSKVLGLRSNISLPLDTGMVLLPLKMRQSDPGCRATLGYVNLLQVEGVRCVSRGERTGGDGENGSPLNAPKGLRNADSGSQGVNICENKKTGRGKEAESRSRKFDIDWKEKKAEGAKKEIVVEAKKSREEFLSVVILKDERELFTMNTPETLRERMRQGEQVLKYFLARRSSRVSFTGLSLEAVLKLMPPCECLLKDLIINMLKR